MILLVAVLIPRSISHGRQKNTIELTHLRARPTGPLPFPHKITARDVLPKADVRDGLSLY